MNTQKIWFTSDHHFGHKNIIEFSKRPFASVDEMNVEMIKRWNEKVRQDDIVYHVGDFALMSPGKLRQLRSQLNGRICLITGNHESSKFYPLSYDDVKSIMAKKKWTPPFEPRNK
jgi:calcineurin-like phosphoesterase family protein